MNDSITIREVSWACHQEDLKKVRFAVFVEEQGFAAEIELDGLDPDCSHVLATLENQAIGTARLLPDGHIGRVAVLRKFRGKGIGKQIMVKVVEIAENRGLPEVELSSQVHAVPFYEQLGYEPVGEIYDEAGAPHQRMVKRL